MMNESTFVGRTTKDVVLQESNGQKFAKITIAIDNGKDNNRQDRPATFVNLTAFNKDAEKFAAHVPKGSLVLVKAIYENGSYQKDGQTKYYHDFKITYSRILVSNKNSSNGSNQQAQQEGGGYPEQTYGGNSSYGGYNPQPEQKDPFDY